MTDGPRRRLSMFGDVRITRGAAIIAISSVGLSLVYLLSPEAARATIVSWLGASPSNVFEHARVWTLVTSPLLEVDFLALLLLVVMLFVSLPTLERFWGMKRFLTFAALTSIIGTTAGVLLGLALGRDVVVSGLGPFLDGSIVAFGIVYAKQPIRIFGPMPITARQFMWAWIGFSLLLVVFQQAWEQGAAFAAAMATAVLMTSKRWSPVLAWRRRRIALARAKLVVLQGGQAGKPATKPKRDEHWLN